MCGIAGILAFSENGLQYLSRTKKATAALKKRGPDGEGFYTHKNVALGHKRLSIIDTSNAGLQPFTDISGRYTIVFNGEIFNYKELRANLESNGIHFKSQSDTEVLLYLYIQKGEACVSELDGEFAFVIYDTEKENLFIARDRFGIKPLFFYKDNDRFVFASELKSLLEFTIPKELDMASLQTYLHLNYIPAPYTIFSNVFKFNAGAYMYIDKHRQEKYARYYTIDKSTFSSYNESYEKAQHQLKGLLEQAVVNRMVADVPLGTFLSGGIDSSVITAIAAKNTKHLNTFSIGYKDEPLFDETRYAQLVAKKYNTNHTVFELTNNDLFENLFDVLDYIDEPFADSSALAVSILSKYTRKHVTVALSGDGADEIFAGYNKHAAFYRATHPGAIERTALVLHPLLKSLPKSRNSVIGNKIRQLDKFAEGSKLSDRERYWLWAGFSGDDEVRTLLYEQSLQEYNKRKDFILKDITADYNTLLLTDMHLVLESDMLVKVDRMSMSRSLEVRVPFLDHKVVDFAFSLPVDYKIDASQRKRILKDAFKSYLPEELYHRGKQGFEVPLLKWFKTDLKSLITDDLLSDNFIKQQNLFNIEAVTKLKQQLFSNNPNDAVAQVWALIVFQYWWKRYFNI
jgi:asparagine synthase (glutamine-hydrolysing)